MERLTIKINGQYLCRINKETEIEVERDVDYVELSTNPQLNVVIGDWYAKSSIIDRLGEFEDFMEKNKYNSIIDLQADLAILAVVKLSLDLTEKENQELKDRWDKLKEWVNTRYNDYRFEGHIVSPEIEELDTITNKMQELEKGE